jgi:hypothetical protein
MTRPAIARIALAVAAFVLAVGGGAARAATPTQAGTSTAVVIVDTGGGTHQSVIHFDGSVSGLTALQLAGANPVTVNYGGSLGQAVCQLYGTGDPAVPGQCPGGWTYFRAVGGAGGWSQSSLGASNTTVNDGDVEGWKYGGGQPPFASFCAVVGCAPPPINAPPPVTAAPAAPPADGGSPTPATAAPGTSGAGSTADGSAAGKDAAGTDSAGTGTTGAKGKDAATSTTRAGDDATAERSARHKARTTGAALGAGTGSDGGGSGSPVGVIVAVVVVALAVAGGLWFRSRRRGPAPG